MPEGPEVQTIVNDLNSRIIGRKIIDTWTDWPKMIKNLSLSDFKKQIKDARIAEVRRLGKNILIDLEIADQRRYHAERRGEGQRKSASSPRKSAILLIHQKMTGHLLIGKWKIKRVSGMKPPQRVRRASPLRGGYQVSSIVKGPMQERVNDFIRLIFYLDNGQQIALSDLRRFAKVLFGPTEEIENSKDLKSLGVDPIDPKTKFAGFKKAITRRARNIKQVLMDQTVISGVGNIYADDILWSAKIHPLRKASNLSEKELKNIWLATRSILKKAIKLRGTSTADFRDTAGKKGKYGNVVLAYRRTGLPCRRCKTPIKRIKIGGRSSHFCSACQKF